jgi:cytochrome b561
MLKNTEQQFGWVTIILHWVMAVAIIGLFVLGLYMTGLGYYDPWYNAAPDFHRSLGLLLGLLLLFRLCWKMLNPRTLPADEGPEILHKLAELVHWMLHLTLIVVIASGYLISTANGRGIDVYDWFTVPAILPAIEHMEDYAGQVHYLVAIAMMVLVGVHALAALKHHFIDHDATLVRMLGSKHLKQ